MERRRRRRAALTCVECRRRKIKCDRKNPCAHCLSTGTACTFKAFSDDLSVPPQTEERGATAQKQQQHPPGSPYPQPRAQQADTTEWPATEPRSHTSSSTTLGGNYAAVLSANSGVEAASQERANAPGPASALRYLLRREPRAERPPASPRVPHQPENGRSILETQLGLAPGRVIMNKTRMLRSSRWAGAAKEFACINSCLMAVAGEMTDGPWFENEDTKAYLSRIGDLLHKCKYMTRCLKVGKPTRGLMPPPADIRLPPRNVTDDMVNLYLGSFEPAFRVLHVPSFRAEYNSFIQCPESAKSDLRLKVLLAIGMGSSLRAPDPELRSQVQQWVYDAQLWLSGPMEKDRLGVSAIQVHCLVLLARQIFTVGGDLVWMSVGSLIHAAMQIGLHRDPSNLPPMEPLQAETRRRLWATILEITVQASLDSAMPPRISLDEFDTAPPSNVDDSGLDGSASPLHQAPRSTYTTSSMQLLLLDSLPTRLRIVQVLNGLRSDIRYDEVLELSAEMTHALQRCAQFVRETRAEGVTSFHSNLLDYLLRRFMVPLHCIFAVRARETPMFHSSLKICLDASLALTSPEPDESFSRLLAVGGGLFREGLRYACSILSLEAIAETESQRNDGTLQRSSAYRNVVKQAVRGLIELAAERIRQGENNVKMHVFLTMILAQVSAMESGLPVEGRMAWAGVDSLEFCYGLLEERASTISPPSADDDQGLSLSVDDAWPANSDFTGFLVPTAAFF